MRRIYRSIVLILFILLNSCGPAIITMEPTEKYLKRSNGKLIDVRVFIEKIENDSIIIYSYFLNKGNASSFCLNGWNENFRCSDPNLVGNLIFSNCRYILGTQLGYDRADIYHYFETDSIGRIVNVTSSHSLLHNKL